MEDELDLSNIECSIFGMGTKSEPRKIDQSLVAEFIANYLSYRSKSELKYIVDRINDIGVIHLEAERIDDSDYYCYDPNYVIPYIKGTSIAEHKKLKPFMISEELRYQINCPENRFSNIGRSYLNFTLFMHNLVRHLILLSDNSVDSTDIDSKKIKLQVGENIEKQLLGFNENSKNNEKNYLITFFMSDCLKRKNIFIMGFDLNEFNLTTLEINFTKNGAYIFSNDDEINKSNISKKLINKFDGIIKTYNKHPLPEEIKKESYDEFLIILREIVEEHNKACKKYRSCPICGDNRFQRSIKLGTNSKYCPECWKLINLIFEIKHLLNTNPDKESTQIPSIIKSLRKEDKGREKYLSNILKNLYKSKIKNKNSIITKYKNQLEILFNIEYI